MMFLAVTSLFISLPFIKQAVYDYIQGRRLNLFGWDRHVLRILGRLYVSSNVGNPVYLWIEFEASNQFLYTIFKIHYMKKWTNLFYVVKGVFAITLWFSYPRSVQPKVNISNHNFSKIK